MDKKLTLSLNASVIEKAKGYAKSHGTSVSRMVETYLSAIVKEEVDPPNNYTPTVSRLIGIVELPRDYETLKSEYADFLSKKYE
ncbi:DUF6364 family protein [Lewinella sp. 4G2]|uniref:DUF6364 family protein n=1 Tax=Lewinella sp. 4G2 TaxID=1803372 RepID=UPI0007B4749F|nr:DUF6364 family protein [Lewinella sp. 4G2]OAV43936.1 hypothetical protein A3850_005260 [Lewinella sp. 4G2]